LFNANANELSEGTRQLCWFSFHFFQSGVNHPKTNQPHSFVEHKQIALSNLRINWFT